MSANQGYSIRKKLIILVTSTTSLTVLIACTTLWIYQVMRYRTAMRVDESATAQLIAESSEPALLFNDANTAKETLAMLRADDRIEMACLYDKAGHVVAHVKSTKILGQCPQVMVPQVRFTRHNLLIFRRIETQHDLTGYLYMQVSLAELYGLLVRFGEMGASVLLLSTVFAFILASMLEGIISKPIIHLTRVATSVSEQNNYHLRATHFTNDETGLLIDQFNSMMDRIEERENDLKLAHSGLEEKIRNRTQDLRTEIAERKVIERDLEAAKVTAEESNRAKSAFLANMSHELRTPLNAIIGYSEMMQEDAKAAESVEMVDDLGKVLASARHLLSLIGDILDLSKIEAGQMKMHLETVLVSNLLYEVLSTAEVLAKKNGNTLECREPMWEGTIHVDPLRFRQCLLNLISNACKFTEGGTISIAIHEARKDEKDWILWSVSDTGLGISPEGRAKLFQSFSQVDSSNTRRFGGSGLGLAISQQFCHAMDAHITVESEVGVGSTFTIHVPVRTESIEAEPAELDYVSS